MSWNVNIYTVNICIKTVKSAPKPLPALLWIKLYYLISNFLPWSCFATRRNIVNMYILWYETIKQCFYMNHNYFLYVKEVQILNMTTLIALKMSNYMYALHTLLYADCFWALSHLSNNGIQTGRCWVEQDYTYSFMYLPGCTPVSPSSTEQRDVQIV